MRIGVLGSLVLHLGAVAFAFVSLPDFVRTKVVQTEVVPVELIRDAELAERTSVPAFSRRPDPNEMKPGAPEKPEPQDAAPTPEKPPERAPEPEPTPEPKPELKPNEKKPEQKPAEREPKPDKKPNADELDLDALSELIDRSRKPNAADEDVEGGQESDQSRAAVGAGDRLAASEIDKMRAAVSRCWNAGAIIGAPNPEQLVVEIDIDLNRDGTLAGQPRVANALQISMSGNRFWKVAEQNAVRAVQACQPYDFFDPARYQDWKEFTLNFDPSIMAGY